jgi:hypothetical protein
VNGRIGGVCVLHSRHVIVPGTIVARVRIHLAVLTDLPPVCVCCGKPATRMRQQEFRVNEALSAAIMVTSAIFDVLVWTKRGITLTLPVCDYHKRRGRRSTRTLVRGMALTAAFGVAAYIGSQFHAAAGNYLAVAAMIAFIVTLVVGMHEVDDGLAVKSLTRDSLTLSGVSRKFAEAADKPSGRTAIDAQALDRQPTGLHFGTFRRP